MADGSNDGQERAAARPYWMGEARCRDQQWAAPSILAAAAGWPNLGFVSLTSLTVCEG